MQEGNYATDDEMVRLCECGSHCKIGGLLSYVFSLLAPSRRLALDRLGRMASSIAEGNLCFSPLSNPLLSQNQTFFIFIRVASLYLGAPSSYTRFNITLSNIPRQS